MSMRALAAAALLAFALSGCSKCDVPTYGWGGMFAPGVCTEKPPVR
jgi:hypothetical protein